MKRLTTLALLLATAAAVLAAGPATAAVERMLAKHMASKTPVELGDPNEASRLMNEETRLRSEFANLQSPFDNLKRTTPVPTVKLTVLDGRRLATQE